MRLKDFARNCNMQKCNVLVKIRGHCLSTNLNVAQLSNAHPPTMMSCKAPRKCVSDLQSDNKSENNQKNPPLLTESMHEYANLG